jgi:carbonic anhydrase
MKSYFNRGEFMKLKWIISCSIFLSASFIALGAFETVSTSATQRTLDYAKGHQEFKNLFFKEHEKDFVRLVEKGQAPKTLFIGCSDSRVIPELISASMPGELFVIRNAGNFVPYNDPEILWDGIAASIQFAVEVLGVSDVIVCGHSHCGAIRGLFQEVKLDALARWLRFGHEAKRVTLLALGENAPAETKYSVAERISVLYQLDHLMTYPYIKEKVKDQKLYLHAWHFTIDTGEIEYYEPESFKFVPLSSMLQKVSK